MLYGVVSHDAASTACLVSFLGKIGALPYHRKQRSLMTRICLPTSKPGEGAAEGAEGVDSV